MNRCSLAGVASVLLAGLSLLAACSASAHTYTASNTAEFEKAVVEANANAAAEANTIELASGIYSPKAKVTFTNTHGLTISGSTAAPGAKFNGGAVQPFPAILFEINAGVPVTLHNVIVTTGGGSGVPAINDSGTLTIESSTIAGNNGAGVDVQPGATATVRNSTLSDGLEFGMIDSGTASFFNSTVAFNNGGIDNTSGTLNLTNTIVAENGTSGNCARSATSSDHSLDSDATCGVGTLSSQNPKLNSSLINNGGPTTTHVLQVGSPAIDAGNTATCLTTDQRGLARPDVASTACDIGATEYHSTPPTITVPANITMEATSSSGAEVTYAASATSSVAKVVSFSCTPASGSTFPVGETTVNCAAKDSQGNTASESFKVTVTAQKPKDTTAPELHVPSNMTVSAESGSGAKVSYTVTATDPDNSAGELTVGCSPASGSTFPLGETTVECSAKDPAGNTTHASFKVTVKDMTPPELHVPSNMTVSAENASGAKVSYTVTATDPDGGELTIECSPASGWVFPLGETTVECSAKDPAGNTSHASFKVTVKDTTPPVISKVPSNITVEATGSSGAMVTYTNPTATDNVDGTDPVTCSPSSGSTFPVGETTVECTSTDKAGNSSHATFKVTVTAQKPKDTTAPELHVPSNMTVSAENASGAKVSYTVTATDPDNSAGELTVECSPVSGSVFPVGETTVECSAKDPAGNTSHASFKVTVKDTTPPVIGKVPSNITVEATSSSGATVTYTNPTATDNVDGTDPVTCSPSSGSTFPVGETTVECTSTDKAGNSSHATFKVTVTAQKPKDTTAPELHVPSNMTVSAENASGAKVSYTVTATDPDNSTGELTVGCSPTSGSTFPVGETTVECSAKDPAGNTAHASFKVTVKDTTPPVISKVPSNITVEATGSSGAMVTYTNPTATDNVDGTDPVTCSPSSGSTFPVGETTVECTSTDKAGNSSHATFKVTVTAQKPPADTTAPELKMPSNMEVSAEGGAGAKVSYTVTATDPDNSAGELTIECSPTSGSTFPLGETTVTCTAKDPAGNTSHASFIVAVKQVAGDPPEAQIRKLLQEVQSSDIPHGVRERLAALLDSVLRKLKGHHASESRATAAARKHHAHKRHHSHKAKQGNQEGGDVACRMLGQFVHEIAQDQRLPSPKIPAALASSWTNEAMSVESSLGCRMGH